MTPAQQSTHVALGGPFSAAVQRTLAQLRKQFPAAFAQVRPLKLGIRDDILARSKLTEVELHRFMTFYTRCSAYLRAQAQAGAMRYDLDGSAVEPVSEANRTFAINELSEEVRVRESHARWLAFRAALLEPVDIPDRDEP